MMDGEKGHCYVEATRKLIENRSAAPFNGDRDTKGRGLC